MSFDLHRRGQRADPLVPLVPHHEDDIAAIPFRQLVGSNLSRRAGRRLHGSLKAVELGAVVVAYMRLSILDIEKVMGHGTLLLASPCSVLTIDRQCRWRIEAPWPRVLSEPLSQGVRGGEALQQPRCRSPMTPEHRFGLIRHAPAPAILSRPG